MGRVGEKVSETGRGCVSPGPGVSLVGKASCYAIIWRSSEKRRIRSPVKEEVQKDC